MALMLGLLPAVFLTPEASATGTALTLLDNPNRVAEASWENPAAFLAPDSAQEQAAFSATCSPRTRFISCEQRRSRVRFFIDGVQVGVALLLVTTTVTTKVNSAAFTGRVNVEVLGTPGIPPGSSAVLTPGCDAPCGAGGEVGGPLITGALWGGDFSYTDPTARTHEPELTVTVTPFIPEAEGQIPGTGVLDIEVRCDDEFRTQLLPGCVISNYIPTMTTMAQLPEIAANIRRIQQAGGYGRPGSPSKALHRETAETIIARNRREACATRITGPRPAGKSCDEYPFATTEEGGLTLPAGARGWAWVPEAEQNSQGGLVSGFYRQNRILDGDPFYVQV